MNKIIEYYNSYDEDGRLTSKSHMPEYLTTMRYIEKYLFAGAKIIEIGAGTGKYSLALADKGYDITAVELVPHNIDIMKKKVKKKHRIKIYEADACDLSFIDDESYDIVLLLGPMYHLFIDDNKDKALSEAIRIAKKGGVIYVSYCNNETCMYKLFHKKKYRREMCRMSFDGKTKANKIREMPFELYRKPEIDKMMKKYDVTRLHFVGVDMLSYVFDNKFDKLTGKEFECYMKYIYSICEREDLVDFSIHMLDIFKKN